MHVIRFSFYKAGISYNEIIPDTFEPDNIHALKLQYLTVLPAKSDSDAMFCLQLLSKTLACTHHLSKREW